MCGFVGWYNDKENIKKHKKMIKKMNKSLKHRGPDDHQYDISDHLLLGHNRLSIIDLKNGVQPMKYKNYTIVYNGEIYNTNEIKKLLIEKGYTFTTTSDTEVLLKGYICFKEKILNMIEGIYAFAIYNQEELFLARDRLGVKPLFYSHMGNDFLFASEIKAILKSKIVKPIITKDSLSQLLSLGPSRVPGSGIFKDIYELRPAHYLTYKDGQINIQRYWNVASKEFNDTFEESVIKIRELLTDSIKRQMVSDVPIACFLSGGLDSSIITAVVSKNYDDVLKTFSIDYEDNNKYFKGNAFQISEDKSFIDIMRKTFSTNHYFEIISQRKLAKLLKKSVVARDYPGMADIDSSLYWFSKQIKKEVKVALSGECADEIFGGYPWFYNEKIRKRDNFPWIDSLGERNNLLKEELKDKLKLKDYVSKAYEDIIKEIPEDSDEFKKLFYINMIMFMPTLLERKDRMTMMASLEARVPFADTKLIEYLWNVPWEYKFYHNKEKGLLREAFKDILPNEIFDRKKNPYPKTHHPKYTKIVTKMLRKRLKRKSNVIYKIFDKDKIRKLIETNGSSFKTPWFGQLMTGPQLLAYLYQFDVWADKYKIILEIN